MKKKAIIISAIILLSALIIPTSYLFYSTKKWDNKIFPNVIVGEVNVGGKSKQEAEELLKIKYGNVISDKKLNIKTEDKTYSIDYNQLNAEYDIEKAIEEAIYYGKKLSVFSKYKLIKNPVDKNIDLDFKFESEQISDLLLQIEEETNREVENASIKKESGNKFTITPEIVGMKLLKEELLEDINQTLQGTINDDVTIEAPFEKVEAEVTEESLSKINSKLSSSSTNFSSSSYGRSTNITLATKSINGIVLMPGESFSFNDVVGKRTKARGYMEAPVIIGDRLEDGLGGGICQVSTTLYNAALKANIKEFKRSHHSMPSHYVKLGMDATVDYGNIDFKFTNTLEYPIYIEGYVSNKNVYFNIYSDDSLTNRKYEIVNDVYETYPATVRTVKDPSMDEGKEEFDVKPVTGYRVRVYRKIYENGKYLERELISNDYYRAINGVKRVGTKKVVAPTPEEDEPVDDNEQPSSDEQPDSTPTPELEPESQPEQEPDSTPTPELEPEPQPEQEPDSTPTPELEPEPESQPTPQPEQDPDPTPQSELEQEQQEQAPQSQPQQQPTPDLNPIT